MNDHATGDASISIRAATMADYDGVCALLDEIHLIHRNALPGVFDAHEPQERRDFVDSMIADAASDIIVAESDGTLIGLAALIEKSLPAASGRKQQRFVEIAILIVSTRCRGRGIGQSLVDRAERWTSERGLSECELGVWEFNETALRFYERVGFVTTRRRMSKSLG